MRQESAASVKGVAPHCQLAPRDGTKLRLLYDRLMANKGLPVEINIHGDREISSASSHARRMLADLRDYYGLDIRCVQRRGGNRWGRKPKPSKWVLAGEWFGRTYVDYIADRLDKHDREATR